MTIHVAMYRIAVHLQLQLLTCSQFKNEIESDIVPLQTSTLCEVVKSIKQKSRKSDALHPVSMNMMKVINSQKSSH